MTELEILAAATAQLAAAERLTEACRAWRDRLVVAQAEQGVPHKTIGAAADLSIKGIGKITRDAGLSRYAPRAPAAPESTLLESAVPG